MLLDKLNKKNLTLLAIIASLALVVLGTVWVIDSYLDSQRLRTFENSKFSILYPKGFETTSNLSKIIISNDEESISLSNKPGDDSEETINNIKEESTTNFFTNEPIESIETSRYSVDGQPALQLTYTKAKMGKASQRVLVFSKDRIWDISFTIKEDSTLNSSLGKIIDSFKVK